MARSPFPRPSIMAAAPRMSRKMRRPEHKFYLQIAPQCIVPFLAAPVVPGETLKNLLWQSRCISTPLNNNVMGWWLEHFFFYVKHRHLSTSSIYTSMMLDLNTDVSSELASGTSTLYNHTVGDMRTVERSYAAVVNEFFRGDGETSATAAGLLSGVAMARLRMPGWWDSMLPDTSLTTLAGGIADDSIGGATLDQIGELGKALETWRALREMGVVNMEYDDWLRSFGVRIAAPQDDRPELIRYTREWQYPSNSVSVDATAQRVSSVLSWSITERADKDRYFKEPGIILGVVVARPKWLHARQQAGVGLLSSAFGWLTPFTRGDYDQMLPVPGSSGYVADVRDLYIHGDQFTYAQRGSLPTARIPWPADGRFAYPTATEINALFVDGASGFLRMDGVVNLSIASQSVGDDATPSTV